MVGATGFEPATPCAQGKLGRPRKVLILERFAASENSWAQIWAHPCGNALLLVTVISESTSPFVSGASPWDNGHMPNATITVDAALKERLAELASQSGQRVDEFVEALLRRIANADVRFDRGVPVFSTTAWRSNADSCRR